MTRNSLKIKGRKEAGERGAAVVIALGICALILALAINFASMSIIGEKRAVNVANSINADFLIQSGMNLAVAEAVSVLASGTPLDGFYSPAATDTDFVMNTEPDGEIKVNIGGVVFWGNKNAGVAKYT